MTVSIHFLTSKLSWRDFETIACICTLIISTESLILIYLIVTRRCAEIFLTGDDCGVGIGWFGLAAGLAGTWCIRGDAYRMVREQFCLTNARVLDQ